jgi:hypothetical protein
LDHRPPGLRVWNVERGNREWFIEWPRLETELRTKLLPQLLKDPSGFRVIVKSYHGKAHWLARLVDRHGVEHCALWFGVDPETNWNFDGLIRAGSWSPLATWQTYQRYSDGSYRRLPSRYDGVEEAYEAQSRDA